MRIIKAGLFLLVVLFCLSMVGNAYAGTWVSTGKGDGYWLAVSPVDNSIWLVTVEYTGSWYAKVYKWNGSSFQYQAQTYAWNNYPRGVGFDSQGNLWLLLEKGSIYKLEGGSLNYISTYPWWDNDDNFATGMAIDDQDRVWVTGFYGKTYYWKNGVWTEVPVPYNNNYHNLFFLNGKVWAACKYYVHYWNGSGWTRAGSQIGSSSDQIPFLGVDFSGNVWMVQALSSGTREVIRKWDGSAWVTMYDSGGGEYLGFDSFTVGPDGNLYITNKYGKVYVFNVSSSQLTLKDDLLKYPTGRIVTDGNGRLWCIFNNVVYYYNLTIQLSAISATQNSVNFCRLIGMVNL